MERAADICRTIINTNQFILEKDRTRLSRTTINGEVLWMKKGQDGNALYGDNWGYKNSPMGSKDMGTWAGNGRPCRGQTSPTQELVDAFPMKNGKSLDEAKESGGITRKILIRIVIHVLHKLYFITIAVG